VAGKAEKMTAVVHELVNGVALDERRCTLLCTDKIERQEQQKSCENSPGQNLAHWNGRNRDGLRSEGTDYRLSH
jgi:hypothetical protein